MKQKKNLICNWWLWSWLQRGERDILGQLQFTWLDVRSANVVALRYSHFIEGTKLEEMGIRTGRNNTYLLIEFYQVYELQKGLRNRIMFLNTAKGF